MLQVDAGNSFIKWRTVLDGAVSSVKRIRSSDLDSLNEVIKCFSEMDGGVAISSVLSADETKAMCDKAQALGFEGVFIAKTQHSFCGLTVGYSDPSQLGVDRWLVMLVACYESRGAVCVVDLGSAITADFVGEGGKHLGGLIMPGLPLLYKTLNVSTGNVRVASHENCDLLLGKSTVECVGAGVSGMLSAAIRHICQLAKELSVNDIYVTGGDASLFESYHDFDGVVHVRPDLVFEGLSLVEGQGGLVRCD